MDVQGGTAPVETPPPVRSGAFHANPPALPPGRTDFHDELVDGPLVPVLVRFSLPLLTTNLLHSLSGTWSVVWVSQLLGQNALTAVVNANVLLYMVMGMVLGVGAAAGIAVGQSTGARDLDSIRRVAGTATSFIGATGLAFGVIGYLATPALLDLMNIPLEAMADARIYLALTFVSMPGLFAFLFLMMMLRGEGDARTPFRFSLVWIGLSLLLGPLLLTGAFGFPKLGIAGPVVGSIIANLIALAGLVAYLYWTDSPFALRGRELRHFWPDPAIMRMLIVRGVPMALESVIVQGAYFLLLSMVNRYGADTAAAYAGAAQLWGYVQMPAISIAASMSALAAMAIGADRWPRVEELALKGCLVGMALTTTMTLLVYALGDLPLKLFLPRGGAALDIARHINWIALWCWIALAVTSGLSGVVRANGATLPPTLIYLVTMWVLRVPFALALQPYWGANAIWWSFPLGAVASAALAYAYYRWGRWRELKKLVPGMHRRR